MFELSPRLYTAAHMADPSLKTVDIGTDHAYLPAYLVSFLNAGKILACDIGEKPLKNALNTLKTYGLEDKIELRLSDGLKNVSPDEAEQIIICGMGGTLIRDILLAAEWVKKPGMRLILQPMTHSEDVRQFLCENGFEIREERCIEDAGRVYCCICAVYTGVYEAFSPGYYYFGTLLNTDGIARTYIKKQVSRVKKRADSLEAADRFPEEQKLLREILDYYGSMKK